jgi:hypothetical protein
MRHRFSVVADLDVGRRALGHVDGDDRGLE